MTLTTPIDACCRNGEGDPLSDHLSYVRRLVEQGGPKPEDYEAFTSWVDRLDRDRREGRLSEERVGELRRAFGNALGPSTVQGFALTKPHGYAGDFEVIDRIYQRWTSPDPRLSAWDRYLHQHACAIAVRNRKTYFHGLLDRCARRVERPRILKIASGPGRSMFEWMTRHPGVEVDIHCVELDPKAIAYARQLNAPFRDRVRFTERNALRYLPEPGAYDLIWAAGIFDYFSDRVFASLLRRLSPGLAPGGELVVGNFSDRNPSRAYLELLGDWNLHHRSAEELVALAVEAGFERSRVRVDAEPSGVNLFLHLPG